MIKSNYFIIIWLIFWSKICYFFSLVTHVNSLLEIFLPFESVILIKGSLHATIFSKYTELLQLKNIFRNFEIIFEVFQKQTFFKTKTKENTVIF